MATNFNVTPYYDDYDVNTGYLRILFKPGHSVQARELTQIQTTLQQQIANMADHFFKEGAMVVPGQSAVDISATYVKIDLNGANSYISPTDFIGRTVTGSISGVQGIIVHAVGATGTETTDDPDTIYVKYTTGANPSDPSSVSFADGDSISFLPNEILTTISSTNQSDYSCIVRPVEETPIGTGSIAFIESGIYYVQKHMVVVQDQKIILDKYTNSPSYRIGLEIQEQVISANDDPSLLDNAQGTQNYNSPGADRYKTTLVFKKREYGGSDTKNFIQLISIQNGKIQQKVRSTDYAVLEETLARRTFDESGDYTVSPFKLDIRALFNENSNRGVFTMKDFEFDTEVDAKNQAYDRFSEYSGMVDGVLDVGLAHTVGPIERAAYPDQDLDTTGEKFYPGRTHADLVYALQQNLSLGLEAGKAYVRGYEIETLATTFVDYKRSRDDIQKNNEYLTAKLGTYVYVTDNMTLPFINEEVLFTNLNTNGPDFVTIDDSFTVTTYAYSPEADFSDANNTLGHDVVATAKVKYVEHYKNAQVNDFLQGDWNGTNASVETGIWKVYLYDFKFQKNPLTTKDYTINDVRSLVSKEKVGTGALQTYRFTSNVLSDYSVIDQNQDFANKNILVSEYEDRKVRGIVYDFNATRSSALVKMLGSGNFTSDDAALLTPRQFKPNEILKEITFTSTGGTTNLFNSLANYRYIDNGARILNKQVIFDGDGSSIVDTYADYVKTVRFIDDVSGNETIDTSYTVQREINAQVINPDGGQPRVVIELSPNVAETFGTYNSDYYFLVKPPTDDANVGGIESIASEDVQISISGKTLTITNLSVASVGQSVKLFIPIIKTEAVEKQKRLIEDVVITPYSLINGVGNFTEVGKTFVSSPSSDTFEADILYTSLNASGDIPETFQDAQGYDLSLADLQLQHSDIHELKKIYDTCNVNTIAYQTNVDGTFKLIVEMTAEELLFALSAWNYYEETGADPFTDTTENAPFRQDILDLIESGGTPVPASGGVPSKIVDVTNRYTFDNGMRPGVLNLGNVTLKRGQSICAGRPIIVYSYFEHSAGDYASVDSYTHANSGLTYGEIGEFNSSRLSDVLDFRPATIYEANDGTTESKLRGYSKISTSGEYPLDNTYVICDYRQYLARKDKVFVDKIGNFKVKYGSSSLTPEYPEDPDDGMVLYRLQASPYTATVQDVKAEMVDNKRYTMRDIGALETRIKSLEYYTSLSLLEKETKDMQITDENGMDRFKNGFVVEPFTGHNIGDVFDPEYNCSIDSVSGQLRPRFAEKNTNMKFRYNDSSHYSDHDGVLLLPYEDVMVINQDKSSKTVNVNPFAIFTFRGSIKLTPASDEWRDVNRQPDLTINREGQFDNIQFLANEMGVLGTEWNNWQTAWTGTEVTGNTQFNDFMRGPGIRRVTGRNETIQTTNNQTRTGITTELVPRVTTENMGDRVVNTEIVPFIRERAIFFHGTRMKPNTKVYPFFDDVDVSEFCVAAQTHTVGSMTQSANNFINDNEQKWISEAGEMTLTGDTSGHQTNVFGLEYVDTNSVRFFVVDNMDNKNYTTLERMYLRDARGNSIRVGNYQSGEGVSVDNKVLKTNDLGQVRGIFNLPNTDNIRFRTGDRIFRLTDQPNNSDDTDTNAQTNYTAKGTIETRQQTILSTRTAEIVQRNISDTRTVQNTTTRRVVESDTGWYDPLAETILIEEDGGAYITSVDLFFSTKDEGIPVTLQLRETVNGYPGQKILPFGEKTLYPNQVQISDDGSLPTNFRFDCPVYVQDSTEYCIVVLADTQGYRCHVSRLGEEALDGSGIISEQPYAGVFFKSQNASTWTADQMEDLKFKVYRAKFDNSKKSTLYFANEDYDSLGSEENRILLGTDSMELTANSHIVTFHAIDHGCIGTDFHENHNYVQITGFKDNALFGGTDSTNSLSGAQLNGIHKVLSTTLDSFSIDMRNVKYNETTIDFNNKTYSAATGTNVMPATSGRFSPVGVDGFLPYLNSNIKYDLMMPIVQNVQLPGTNIQYKFKSISGASQDGDQIAGVKDSNWSTMVPNSNITFNAPRMISSRFNEQQFNSGNAINKKSLVYEIDMYSESDNLSPQVDTQRCSAILVSNRTNSPQWTSDVDANGIQTDTNLASGNIGHVYTGFVSELESTGGSVDATYITREIQLAQPSKSMKIVITANRPADTDIDLYYKTKSSDSLEYRKLPYTFIERPDGYGIPANSISDFREFEYDIRDIEEFVGFGVKIVLRSKNSSIVPRVSDLRIVALAT